MLIYFWVALLGYTSGLNLSKDLGLVLALFKVKCDAGILLYWLRFFRTRVAPVALQKVLNITECNYFPLIPSYGMFVASFFPPGP